MAQLMANAYYVAALCVVVLLLVYMLVARRDPLIWPKSILAALLPVLFSISLLIDPHLILTVINVSSASYTERVVVHDPGYAVYAATIVVLFVSALLLQYRKFRQRQTKKARRRESVVLMSLVVAGPAGLIFNLILPWRGQYDYIALGPLFAMVFIIGIAYSTVQYSTYDLKQAFARSFSYATSLSAVAVLYTIGVWALSSGILVNTNRLSAESVYLIIALVTAVAFTPIKQLFDRLTSRLFFRRLYSASDVLDAYGDLVASTIDLEVILEGTVQTVSDMLHPSFVAILLIDESDGERRISRSYAHPDMLLEKLNRLEPELYAATTQYQAVRTNNDEIDRLSAREVGIVVRMSAHDATIGYIVIGHQSSGDSYSTLDLSVMTTIADELALAAQNTYKYQEIEQFNTKLRREITRATRQLRRSNTELMEMDRVKDEFVSMASHQLRTPLTSIKGYISMLLDGDAGRVTPEQRKFLDEAYMSSERMVRLIGDFLNVSRLQTGKFMLDIERTDLAELVQHAVNQSTQLANGRSIQINYRHSRRIPALYLDSTLR